MLKQDASEIISIIETGTTAMLVFSVSVIILVYVFHRKLVKQKRGGI